MFDEQSGDTLTWAGWTVEVIKSLSSCTSFPVEIRVINFFVIIAKIKKKENPTSVKEILDQAVLQIGMKCSEIASSYRFLSHTSTIEEKKKRMFYNLNTVSSILTLLRTRTVLYGIAKQQLYNTPSVNLWWSAAPRHETTSGVDGEGEIEHAGCSLRRFPTLQPFSKTNLSPPACS